MRKALSLPPLTCQQRDAVERNMALARRLLKLYDFGHRESYTWQDIEQLAYMGLMRAVQKFDPSRGVKLSTYAQFWVRSVIQHNLAARDRMIRVPCSRSGRHRFLPVESLDVLLERDDPILETSLCDDSGGLDDLDTAMQSKDTAESLLSVLDDRSRRILLMRLEGNATLEGIGRKLNMTRERVRQIVIAAMNKIKAVAYARMPEEFAEQPQLDRKKGYMPNHQCVVCGKEFWAPKMRQRSCSVACGTKLARQVKKGKAAAKGIA